MTPVLRVASTFLQSPVWLALRFTLFCFFLFRVGSFGGGEYDRFTVGTLAERRVVDNVDGGCSRLDAVVDNTDDEDADEHG